LGLVLWIRKSKRAANPLKGFAALGLLTID